MKRLLIVTTIILAFCTTSATAATQTDIRIAKERIENTHKMEHTACEKRKKSKDRWNCKQRSDKRYNKNMSALKADPHYYVEKRKQARARQSTQLILTPAGPNMMMDQHGNMHHVP